MNGHPRPGFAGNSAIDQLVDGQLNDDERRELLLQLEQEPDGWRRCALAFLEDQTLRQALTTPGSATRNTLPMPGYSAKVSPRKRVRLNRVPIAATVLAMTFAAGFAAGGLKPEGPRVEVARPDAVEPAPSPPPSPPAEVREVGSVELVDGSSGESPPDRFPIRSGPGLDSRWVWEQPRSVPEYVRARLERQGYQVDERRKLVSVQLEDGRQVSIPIDEVKLDYVGKTPL